MQRTVEIADDSFEAMQRLAVELGWGDGLPLVATWGGGVYTPRATARLGRLVLHEGNWEGRQLLSKEAVRKVTGDAGLTGHCGLGWWSNGGLRYPRLPRDAVWGAGARDRRRRHAAR